MEQRVYVGNIYNQLDECLDLLKTRLEKFGVCSAWDKHATFAYMNIKFGDDNKAETADDLKNNKQWLKLKQSLNNVKFMGNVIKIDLAKPNWQEAWKLQNEKDKKDEIKLDEKLAKKDRDHHKKLSNINKDWKDLKQVIPGRLRTTPRKRHDLRNATFRINVDGSLKVYKCYKNKLWGYERNRQTQDLSFKFINGKWWNDFNHIVDKLDYSRSKSFNSKFLVHDKIEQAMKDNKLNNKSNSDDKILPGAYDVDNDEDIDNELEKEKYNNILSTVLDEIKFDEPLNVVDSDEAEHFGLNNKEEEEEEYYEDENYNNYDNNYDNNYNNNYDKNESYNYNNYNEDESYKKKDKYSKKEEPISKNEQDDEDQDEFIPTFGAKVVEGTISNTETLRQLFNDNENKDTISNDNGTFKLFDGDNQNDNDIDHDKELNDELLNNIPTETLLSKTKQQNRLFFPHFNSPFLVGQTQLSIVQNVLSADIWDKWDETFWENRGTWMKELKNKKRDATRQLRKRKLRDSTTSNQNNINNNILI